VIGVFASLAIIDAPNMYVNLGIVAGFMGFVYAVRTLLVILVMVIGIWSDDPKNYTNFGDDTLTDDKTLYRAMYAWGSEIRLYDPSTYLV